jgi:hypothetical protein
VSDVIRRVLVVLLVLSVPAAASGQTPWQTGVMAGTVLHREPRSTAGLDASVIVRRHQTPLVEVIAAVGALWFPETRTDFRVFNPDGTTFTESQTQATAGPYVMLHAGRRAGRGTTDVLLVASAPGWASRLSGSSGCARNSTCASARYSWSATGSSPRCR